LMDIHHDTSFRSILEDDSIFLAFRAHIYSCSSKGARLWLVVRPSIYSFCIAHFIFISMLHFRVNLIQLLAFSFFTCECGHGLHTFGTHLACYSFEGQRITTHDTFETSCMPSHERMGMLYEENCGTPLCQEFHYEPIFI
jgi:hypothetical protein